MKMLYIKHRSGKRMNNFALSAILAAKELGIDFTIANNMSMAEPGHFEQVCEQYGIKMVHIDFDRNPLSLNNIKAGKQLLTLMEQEKYDIVHCNTPSGGMVGRLCANKAKVPKVIYMAHGFHFWKGAPLKNWLCYYTVERFLAHFTDRLITINQEDYACAQHFHYKKGGHAEYVPGVGIDIDKVRNVSCDREQKRAELGISENVRAYVTVAELIPRKGYETLLRAFRKADLPNAELLICGTGAQEETLKKMTTELALDHKVHFLGFRADVYEILKAADVFVFPSKQEGLPVALMEAMAADLPCVVSRIRGNVDLMSNSQLLFDAGNVDALRAALEKAFDETVAVAEIAQNRQTIRHFDMNMAVAAMKNIYLNVMDESGRMNGEDAG